MKARNILTIAAIALLVISASVVSTSDQSDADSDDWLLIDYGDGNTEWVKISPSGTLKESIIGSAASIGISVDASSTITVDGITSVKTGSNGSGGSFISEGTTGRTVTCNWQLYLWDGSWNVQSSSVLSTDYEKGSYALGFYPQGTAPCETPEWRTSWTMIHGNAQQDGVQNSNIDTTIGYKVIMKDEEKCGVYSSILFANGQVIAKYGSGMGMQTTTNATLVCYDLNGNALWSFTHPGNGFYEVMTPAIIGEYVYLTGAGSYIFKIPLSGPGDNYENVTTYGGAPYDLSKVTSKVGCPPFDIDGKTYTGSSYATGSGNLIYANGVIYSMHSNGMVYCFDLDLNLIWSSERNTRSYYDSPAVIDGYLFCGDLSGILYAIDAATGKTISSSLVYSTELYGQQYGSIGSPSVIRNENGYDLFFTFSDGRGMSSKVGGIAHYTFDGKTLAESYKTTESGKGSHYCTVVDNESFTGIYFMTSVGLLRLSTDNVLEVLQTEIDPIHAPIVLVNGSIIYAASYSSNGYLYTLGLDGKILTKQEAEISNYSMSPITIIGNWTFAGNDGGMSIMYGQYTSVITPSDNQPWYMVLVYAIITAAIIIAAIYAVMRFGLKVEKPFKHIAEKMRGYVKDDGLSHNTRSRHRLRIVLLIGALLIIIMLTVSLCIGSTSTLSIGEMFGALGSAISKGGQNLTGDEITVYSSRLPRTLAAIAVGIGLAIAGSIYQAVIRNPLCDPYIMGVSSGAGTAAVAVIAFDFTFFGFFGSHSLFLTAIVAMIGGLLAFGCTMLIAEKAGGTSINYVLAGVVVGLAFSAVQTLMISMAGSKVTNALTWLFGSFSNVSWTQVWVIVIPAIALSLVTLFWAKELNLILLGEDQARQMGLDVRKFTRGMLILASVLTSVCVAFVGIIGFVGLVVPHLCRMILGGDHRLVLPASIVVGAVLMLLADFASRMLIPGMELPVGAITTVIGVPVFAYMLIKKGRMYDG